MALVGRIKSRKTGSFDALSFDVNERDYVEFPFDESYTSIPGKDKVT